VREKHVRHHARGRQNQHARRMPATRQIPERKARGHHPGQAEDHTQNRKHRCKEALRQGFERLGIDVDPAGLAADALGVKRRSRTSVMAVTPTNTTLS